MGIVGLKFVLWRFGCSCQQNTIVKHAAPVSQSKARQDPGQAMLENLSNKLQKILKDLRGQGRVSERHIDETAREIRNALLDADVHFKIARDFVQRVKERALGQDVMQSLTPGQQVVKVVRDELIGLLGGEQA